MGFTLGIKSQYSTPFSLSLFYVNSTVVLSRGRIKLLLLPNEVPEFLLLLLFWPLMVLFNLKFTLAFNFHYRVNFLIHHLSLVLGSLTFMFTLYFGHLPNPNLFEFKMFCLILLLFRSMWKKYTKHVHGS